MRWIMLALFCSSAGIAQPIEGPFLLYADSSDSYDDRTFFLPISNFEARLFYTRSQETRYVHASRVYSLAAHQFLTDEEILSSFPESLSLDTVTVRGDSWALYSQYNPLGWSIIFGNATEHDSSGASIGCGLGQLPAGLSTQLLPAISGEWTYVVFSGWRGVDGQPSAACAKISNLSFGATDYVFSQTDTVLIQPRINAFVCALTEDSFAVMHDHNGGRAEISLISGQTEFDEVWYYVDDNLLIKHLIDAEWLGNSRFRIFGHGQDHDDLYVIVRDIEISNELATAVNINGQFSPSAITRVPTRGWAVIDQAEDQIRLACIDTFGAVVSGPQGVVWREEPYQFAWSRVSADSNGRVLVYFGEETSDDPLAERVQFVSVQFGVPFDTEPRLSPVASEYSLTTYPNPFNATVCIDYELPHASDVELSVFNTLGQQVATLFNGRATAGTHSLNWSPAAASGIYFVKLASGDFITSRKILYLR